MNDGTTETEEIFSPADRLKLLQLTTKRAVAVRRTTRSAQKDQVTGPPSEGISEDPVPERWRLLPDEVQLYEWQQRCLPLWLERGRGTVKVATGGGKTLFALAAAQELQNTTAPDLRLAVVVPTIPLMFQWHEELRRGNLPDQAIGLMGGGQELPPLDELRVVVSVLNSARVRLPDLVRDAGWSQRMLLVVDECHRSGAEQARRIFESSPRYTMGLSATPEQDLETQEASEHAYESGVVGQALGPIIFDFTLRESQEAGLLTPFEVWHVGLPLGPFEAAEHERLSREITELRKGLQVRHRGSRSKQSFLAWCQSQVAKGGPASADAERFMGLAAKRKRLLYRAAARREVTLGALSDASGDETTQAIVFHESIQEIEVLFLSALDRGIPAVLEHSELSDGVRADNIEAFRAGVARAIISARSLVEGFNVPSADLGIIAASSGSVRQRIQSLGRMLRLKPGGGTARILVLYVRDTEDEAIYEKADWADVIGAQANRYFTWDPADDATSWAAGLSEIDVPPRAYRPPSWEVDADAIKPREPYPARPDGLDVRVDQQGNLRAADGALLVAPRKPVDAIIEMNRYRRARITPAGHLIARVDGEGAGEPDWRFLGLLDVMVDERTKAVVRLSIQQSAGRRVIARSTGRGAVGFALGPETGGSEPAGHARDTLLEWLGELSQQRDRQIRHLYWDGGTDYWVEVNGERIAHPEGLPPLEFRS